jgi:exo-beta-1,3-glucanase (GH17 family)
MEDVELPNLEFGRGVCYSGYREGQSPVDKVYPSREEIREDLQILQGNWQYLRVFDASPHAERVLEVIADEGMDFRVMLGAGIQAEVSNPGCPWDAEYGEEQLAENRTYNREEIQRVAALANRYPGIVCAVSIGNEASVEWTDHLVPTESLIEFARTLKGAIAQPVTFCENYVPWTGHLDALVKELDFISIHTYPVWEYQTIESAIEYTRANYESVVAHNPGKPVVITEAGWTTTSNGRGIDPWNASQDLQAHYFAQLMEWTEKNQVLTFVFEAFDEPWKGSPDPREPEKHWGLFTVDRRPKLVMKELYAHL